MNGTQHNKIKKENDVNERLFFICVCTKFGQQMQSSLVRALPKKIALGLQRPFKLVVTLTAGNIF